jgi:hypothetical protein
MITPQINKIAREIAQEFGADVAEEMEGRLAKYNDEKVNQFGISEIFSVADSILNICISLYCIFTIIKKQRPDAPNVIVTRDTFIKAEEEILGGDLSPEDRNERKQILEKARPHFENMPDQEESGPDEDEQ